MLVPIFVCILLRVAIGNRIAGLVLGVINDEVENYTDCFNASLETVKVRRSKCVMQLLSCRFIDQFDQNVAELVRIPNKLLSAFDQSFCFRNSMSLMRKPIAMLTNSRSTDISKSTTTSRTFSMLNDPKMP
jgi:hypothetical protein